MLSLKPRPFVQSSFDMQASRWPHVFLSCFLLFGDVAFSDFFCPLSALSLYGEYVVRSFLPDGDFFYLVTTGCIFDISLCENSIDSINELLLYMG